MCERLPSRLDQREIRCIPRYLIEAWQRGFSRSQIYRLYNSRYILPTATCAMIWLRDTGPGHLALLGRCQKPKLRRLSDAVLYTILAPS
jgi:hypothetical protein